MVAKHFMTLTRLILISNRRLAPCRKLALQLARSSCYSMASSTRTSATSIVLALQVLPLLFQGSKISCYLYQHWQLHKPFLGWNSMTPLIEHSRYYGSVSSVAHVKDNYSIARAPFRKSIHKACRPSTLGPVNCFTNIDDEESTQL